jgi:uncharacterized membrane protein (DUF373 family)
MFTSTLGHAPVSTPNKPLIDRIMPTQVVVAYGSFGFGAWFVYHHVAEKEFSSILTMASIVQALGALFMCLQVSTRGSAAGISARGLMLDAIAVAFRLSSTLWLDGYLPSDKSGDAVYQFIDLFSLALLVFVLRCVLVTYRRSYQEDEEMAFSVSWTVLVCVALASVFHADMDGNVTFDTIWMAGLFISVVASLPQLSMIVKTGLRADAMTCHYIAAMAFSRILSSIFMWEAQADIECDPWVGNLQHGIIAILIAHLLHLALIADFMYYYMTSIMQTGFRSCEPMKFHGPVKIGLDM